jgi:hypothetical protein
MLLVVLLGAACDDDNASPEATASSPVSTTQTTVPQTPDPFASDEFDIFGFSFRKGEGVRVTDIALSTGTPSAPALGYVTWDSNARFFEGLAWNQTNDHSPAAAFDTSARRAENTGATIVERGPIEMLDVDDLGVAFQGVTIDATGETYYGLFSAWYCEGSKTEFLYSAYDLAPFDNQAHVRQFVEGFDC